jgi:hypothetical protein
MLLCPSAGHTFIVFLDGGFPVNCLNAVKNVTEVSNMFVCTYRTPVVQDAAKGAQQAPAETQRTVLFGTSWRTHCDSMRRDQEAVGD